MQDNKSAILLQKNYPYSIKSGSKHINVSYHFATDQIRQKELNVLYCPTKDIIADYNSKPTQGVLFIFQRNTILGIKFNKFNAYKQQYAAVLKKYDLFDEHEKDLNNI